MVKILAKDEASSRRAQTSQGRNRRAEITDERREEINRRQREYQRDRRARMTEEEREESKRKQRDYQREYRARQKAASQNNCTSTVLTQTLKKVECSNVS